MAMLEKGGAMAEEAAKLRLGRGLAALIGDMGDEMAVVERARGSRKVPVEFLRPNPRNPRKRFSESDLGSLTVSIRERGIVQPIVVRPVPNLPDAYEIVAGERRWRAAQMAGLHEVPVVIVEIDDRTSLEYAVLENVQRTDLNAIEEAEGYQRLMDEFRYTQAELSTVLGKSRPHVANMLRLLSLPEPVKQLVIGNNITAGHARALLAVRDPEAVAKRVVEKNLSVREVEEIAHAEHGNAEPHQRIRMKPGKDPDTRAVERALEDVLGLKVSIEHRGNGGELRIKYKSLDQLDGLCRRLKEAAGR
jgi:ParB family chromosome partitioning protein